MPAARARQLLAIVTMSASLIVGADPAQANDGFRHPTGGLTGPYRAGDSGLRGAYGGIHSRNLDRYWARRWHRVYEQQSQFDPYGYGYDPYRYGPYRYDQYGGYGYRYDLGLYERFYLDRYYAASSCDPFASDVACSLPAVGSRGPAYSSGDDAARPSVWRAYEEPFSLEQELAEIYEASGWTPLSDGRTDDALRRFAKLVERRPNRGVPRIGLALATAELGDRERGVDLMREALRVEGKALYDVPVDARLRERLTALGRHYPATEFGTDAHFMLAALRYLGGENNAARTSIERALARGDDSESTETLRRLIDARPRR